MPSPMLPFQANIGTANGEPWRLRLSQGFNEALFYGTGNPQDAAHGDRITRLMRICNGEIEPIDAKEELLAQMMAVAFEIEYLAIALDGQSLSIDNDRAFIEGMKRLTGNLHAALDGRAGPVSNVLFQALAQARAKWVQPGQPRAGFVEYGGLPDSISLPLRHMSFLEWLDLPALNDDGAAQTAGAPA